MQNIQETARDMTLVSECLRNPSDYVHVVNRYEKRLAAFARRHSGLSFEEIEDVLQEAFVRLYLHLHEYDPSLKLENWLFRIVRNLLIDDFRKRKKLNARLWLEGGPDPMDSFAKDQDWSQLIEHKAEIETLVKIIDSLPDPYREVAILRFFEDKDYSEMSDILLKPVGTVASLLKRARKKITESLTALENQNAR